MLRYYPSFRVKTDLITNGNEFKTKSGPYKGKYYMTYNGKLFTGPNPIIGPNEELSKIPIQYTSAYLNETNLPENVKKEIEKKTNQINKRNRLTSEAPVSYFPFAIESDYKKGYLLRSFIKRVNDKGFVIEISNQEYDNFINGTVNYDVSDYLTLQILWKITGPLNSIRVNQYDTRAGIIDTNKRLVENGNNTFLGITDFIGGEYTKFAKPIL